MTTPPPYGPYPTPPPKKGLDSWAIVGITLGGFFAVLLVIAIAVGAGNDTGDGKAAPKATAASRPATGKPAAAPTTAPPKSAVPAAEPTDEPSVKVTAKKTKFAPSILNDGSDFTSVEVTIVNNGEEKISVNPLDFTITDTTGLKHQAELGEDKNQIDTLDLEPGEKAIGAITGKGKFTPKYVTFTDSWFGEGIRGNVS